MCHENLLVIKDKSKRSEDNTINVLKFSMRMDQEYVAGTRDESILNHISCGQFVQEITDNKSFRDKILPFKRTIALIKIPKRINQALELKDSILSQSEPYIKSPCSLAIMIRNGKNIAILIDPKVNKISKNLDRIDLENSEALLEIMDAVMRVDHEDFKVDGQSIVIKDNRKVDCSEYENNRVPTLSNYLKVINSKPKRNDRVIIDLESSFSEVSAPYAYHRVMGKVRQRFFPKIGISPYPAFSVCTSTDTTAFVKLEVSGHDRKKLFKDTEASLNIMANQEDMATFVNLENIDVRMVNEIINDRTCWPDDISIIRLLRAAHLACKQKDKPLKTIMLH